MAQKRALVAFQRVLAGIWTKGTLTTMLSTALRSLGLRDASVGSAMLATRAAPSNVALPGVCYFVRA